jgi:hypothetical protein
MTTNIAALDIRYSKLQARYDRLADQLLRMEDQMEEDDSTYSEDEIAAATRLCEGALAEATDALKELNNARFPGERVVMGVG